MTDTLDGTYETVAALLHRHAHDPGYTELLARVRDLAQARLAACGVRTARTPAGESVVPCSTCEGSGAVGDPYVARLMQCGRCGGMGWVPSVGLPERPTPCLVGRDAIQGEEDGDVGDHCRPDPPRESEA